MIFFKVSLILVALAYLKETQAQCKKKYILILIFHFMSQILN